MQTSPTVKAAGTNSNNGSPPKTLAKKHCKANSPNGRAAIRQTNPKMIFSVRIRVFAAYSCKSRLSSPSATARIRRFSPLNQTMLLTPLESVLLFLLGRDCSQ